MFHKRGATLVVSDIMFVVSPNIILLRLAAVTAVDVDGEVVIGHHQSNLSKKKVTKTEKSESDPVRISAGKSGCVMGSYKSPKCTAIGSERSRGSHLIHLMEKIY